MPEYKIISEPRVLDGITYTAYGIAASDGTVIRDISDNKSFITRLLGIITKRKVSTDQFPYVVEDALC